MVNQKIQLYINGNIYDVNILRTNNKNIYLKIKNKQLIVSAPCKVPLQKVETFVETHIVKFVAYLHRDLVAEMINIEKNYFYMFGSKYYFKVLTGFAKGNIQEINHTVYIQSKNGDESEVLFALKQYFKQKLDKYLLSRLLHYEKAMRTFKHTYRIISKNTSWASNNINNKNLSFAIKLVHYDLATIDYVIIHELAHDFEPNHSKNFWKIVQFYCPEFSEARKKLRNLS